MGTICFRKTMLATAIVALSIAMTAGANAASPTATAPNARVSHDTASRALSSDDRQFAMKAAEAGMAEVELGKLAEQKAQDEQVKQFGARMVRDHTHANDQLKQVIASNNLTLPTRLDKSAQKDLDQLTKLSGEKFDKQYIDKQVSDHKKVIGEFEKEAKSGNDADLRAFASNTLPTLHEHLKLAQAAEKALSDEASKSASSGSSSSSSGIKAAKKATGISAVTAEKQEHMPVPKTGM